MDSKTNLTEQLSDIRSMMEKSTKILSLSGLAGVSIGVTAICGMAGVMYIRSRIPAENLQQYILSIAIAVLIVAIGLSVSFSYRLAKRKNLPIWNNVARLLIVELAIPLIAGGLFSIALMRYETYNMIPAALLLFYGLALTSASKFTVKEIRYLGIAELLVGSLAALLPEHGLNFWVVGFGVLHIVYGLRMYLKYEK